MDYFPITYCLENKVGGDWNSAKETATNVHYKAQVYYASGDEKIQLIQKPKHSL